MGIGPAEAIRGALDKAGLKLADMDIIEVRLQCRTVKPCAFVEGRPVVQIVRFHADLLARHFVAVAQILSGPLARRLRLMTGWF